ncbi:MAG: hypothetical protein HFJ48_05280 [Clostridia bacterium]|nr:hypothetical protein [Clostridia bacterium]
MMETEKTEKKVKKEKKAKVDTGKLVARIIAAVMLVILLAGSFYSLIYILINNK